VIALALAMLGLMVAVIAVALGVAKMAGGGKR
jgi:hypothetical protein